MNYCNEAPAFPLGDFQFVEQAPNGDSVFLQNEPISKCRPGVERLPALGHDLIDRRPPRQVHSRGLPPRPSALTAEMGQETSRLFLQPRNQ